MTASSHPLCGQRLVASSFRHVRGVLCLLVALPDSTCATVAVEATDILGVAAVERPGMASVLSPEGLRRLRALIEALDRQESPATAGEASR